MSAIPSPALQHAIALSLGASVVRSDDLIDRVMEHGFHYRGYVSNAVAKAVRCGMILRVGEGLARNYRLNPDWKIDQAALAAAQAQRVRGTRPGMTGAQKARSAAGGYEGPAFDKGPLTPSIGTVCQSQEDLEGELPPYLGGRLVDSLHNHFDRIFGGVE
ncbi:TPA: hypothetical protein UL936_001997 [Stenotrophomonas maltophilia]|nr:hypothetical protein [Stenotrophomonas maltophilia]